MRLPINVVVPGVRGLCMTGALLLGATRTEAQAANGAKLDPGWLRADAASKTAELKLVGGLTDQNGGMNFNGYAIPGGPVQPAFEHAATGRVEQGFPAGQGADVRFVAGKAGAFLIFCAVPGHGAAGMWIRLTVSATADKPALTTAPER